MEIVLCERAKCLEMEMSGKCTEKFLRTVDARGTPERETRWLYCVECPQYSIRLEELGCIS